MNVFIVDMSPTGEGKHTERNEVEMNGSGGLLRRIEGAPRPRYVDADQRPRGKKAQLESVRRHGYAGKRWAR